MPPCRGRRGSPGNQYLITRYVPSSRGPEAPLGQEFVSLLGRAFVHPVSISLAMPLLWLSLRLSLILALSFDDRFPTGIISVVLIKGGKKEGEQVNYISKIDIMSQTSAGRES